MRSLELVLLVEQPTKVSNAVTVISPIMIQFFIFISFCTLDAGSLPEMMT